MTSRFQPPPIIKAAERMAVEIEKAVRRFARCHRMPPGPEREKERSRFDPAVAAAMAKQWGDHILSTLAAHRTFVAQQLEQAA